jgi:dTDP-6-deoxy-L-talose 4-dehydrogenase (NAD+)
MRVLITGATGFIGGALTSLLENKNIEVFALIRNGLSEFQIKYPKVILIQGDLDSITRNQIDTLKIDTLVHLAWENVSKVLMETHLVHLETQKVFMEKVMQSNISKVIISGSCFEYGKIEGEIGISVNPNPNTKYGIAKHEFKMWLLDYWSRNNSGMEISWMRVFYVYGENQHERSLYSQLMTSIKEKRSEFHMSRGFQIRDFIKIDDVAFIFYEEIINYHFGFKIMNICSGNPVSVREFVENVLKENNARITLNLGKFPIPDYEPIAFWGRKEYSIKFNK